MFNSLRRPAIFTIKTTLALWALLQLSACAPLLIGGTAATTAVVVTDRRTAGEQVDDKSIEIKANAEARKILHDQDARVVSSSYGGQVLLVGNVPEASYSERIVAAVKPIDQVKEVISRVQVGPILPLSTRTNDGWITTKVSSTLLNTKEVPSRTIKTTTEDSVVYLQGRVTHDEGQRAAKAAARVAGVKKVVTLFDYVSAEKVLVSPPQSQSNNAQIESTPTPAATSNEPEVFTID